MRGDGVTKTAIVMTIVAACVAGGATPARAQSSSASDTKAFLSLDVGAQPQQRTVTTSSSFPLYDETATVETSQPVHNGPVFGVTGGYRVRPTLGIAVGLTFFNARTSEAAVSARIPDPAFFDRPRTVGEAVSGLEHQELGIHIQAVWFKTLSEKIDVALSAGPSIINVKHDLVTATVSTGTQALVTAKTTEKKNAFGVNVGGEGIYKLSPGLGVALFVRYAGGKVDLPSVSDLTVGGLQAGLGVRVRF